MTPTAIPAPRGRVQFLLLAMLFFFPLLASYALYFLFPEYRPSGTTNYGQLVNPAQPLPELKLLDSTGAVKDEKTALRGRWSYVVLASGDCDETCLHRLVLLRQVRLIMNEKRSRVQRVLVVEDAADVAALKQRLAPEHPDLNVLTEAGAAGARLSDFLQPRGAGAYLVDPNGNWLMVYPLSGDVQTEFKGLQRDLKRLLKLSQIG